MVSPAKINHSKPSYTYTLPEVFLVIAVFTKELGTRNDFGIDFDYLGYPFFILYFLVYIERIIRLNSTPKLLLLYLTLSSAISILFLHLSFDGFFKQIIPIVIILSVCFTVLNGKNINMVFLLYVRITFWTAIFGIIQVILSLNGIDILIKQSGRLDSIAYEPSHYASLLMPALVYTYINLKYFRVYFFVMLTALFLTYNLTCYLVFLAVFTFASFHPLYVLVTVPIAYYLFFNVLPTLSPNFNMRFTDTFSALSGEKNALTSSLNVNGTTLSLFSNYEVAKYSLSQSPLFGSGLGGHEEMYYRRFAGSAFEQNVFYGLNAKSAHSLSIRILSELGIVGSALYLYIMFKNLVMSKKGLFYAVSLSCISHFLCKSFKLGGYIDYGTPFFFTILVLNARAYRAQESQKNAHAKKRPLTFPLQQTT